MLARIATEQGDEGAADAIIREIASRPTAQPVLIHSPKWELPNPVQTRMNSTVAAYGGDEFDDQWVDIGFWVQPDGKVAELQILRQSGDAGWVAPLLESIGGRIYSPTDPAQGGAYRVERYTYTSALEKKSGTRIVRRSGQARIEYLDLTAPSPVQSAEGTELRR